VWGIIGILTVPLIIGILIYALAWFASGNPADSEWARYKIRRKKYLNDVKKGLVPAHEEADPDEA